MQQDMAHHSEARLRAAESESESGLSQEADSESVRSETRRTGAAGSGPRSSMVNMASEVCALVLARMGQPEADLARWVARDFAVVDMLPLGLRLC